MNRVKKTVVAGFVVVCCAIAGLVALAGSTAPLVPFHEVAKRTGTIEVFGMLDKPSIRPLRGYNLVAFNLRDEKTGERLQLLYDNPASSLPANFPTARDVKATGVYDAVRNKFVTDSVMTKCPSKYKVEDLDETTREAMKKWKQAEGTSAASAKLGN